jgi:hypothetical protein
VRASSVSGHSVPSRSFRPRPSRLGERVEPWRIPFGSEPQGRRQSSRVTADLESRVPSRMSSLRVCWGSFFPIVKKDPHHQQILPPSPRIASAPAVSAGAADAGKAGEGPGVRGHSSSDRPRLPPTARTQPLAQKPLLPFSHKNSILPRSVFRDFKLRPWRISFECRQQCDKRKTCPRRAVGMAPGAAALPLARTKELIIQR